jgi:nudix-type nucleoside diphosphatase (YffH/AdpP family)
VADKGPKAMRKVQIESKKRLFDDFMKIDEAVVRFERFDGTMSPPLRRLNLERGDSVAALILNRRTRRVTLVNQFRFPTYEKGPGWIMEVVAGIVDSHEAPENAVRREILEETGYRVSAVAQISTFYLSPGGSSERIILYCAEVDGSERISKGGGVASEDEDVDVLELSYQEAWEALDSGKIVDAKTIIALNWLRDSIGGQHDPSDRHTGGSVS